MPVCFMLSVEQFLDVSKLRLGLGWPDVTANGVGSPKGGTVLTLFPYSDCIADCKSNRFQLNWCLSLLFVDCRCPDRPVTSPHRWEGFSPQFT